MAEVYCATGTKLNREVATRVFPESFAQDLDRMTRFTREAQLLPRSTVRTSRPSTSREYQCCSWMAVIQIAQ